MHRDRIGAPALRDRIVSARQAAEQIGPGMTVGFSGFTAVGYPKLIPPAIAELGRAKDLTVIAGASTGDELDGSLARAGCVRYRTPFNVNADLRAQINSGAVRYADQHLGRLPEMISARTFGRIDWAVVECSAITEDGIVPTLSVGATNTLLAAADRVLLELNVSRSEDLLGLHDIFSQGPPPRGVIPILRPEDRIGVPVCRCDMQKVAGVVLSDRTDGEPRFLPPDQTSQRIAGHIIRLLKQEVEAGRLPQELTIQSGFGAVANAVLYGLESAGAGRLDMYTEVIQDGALELLLKGKLRAASATSLSLSSRGREAFYRNLEELKGRVVLRPQDISNSGAVIHRLGVVAMNTAMEADLYGNVNSTHVMGSGMMNGIGGSGDFARNSALSVFMTPSTAKGGLISCIVPMVSHVDHTEHDVQIIVTEQGLADLRGRSPVERAELIIENCAHPDYAPMLRAYLEHAKKVSVGRHTPHDMRQALSWHVRYLETGSMK